jgi:hypothetical protein
MRKTVDLVKWVSVSITVTCLVTVFWVWPAWNSGPQTWYWGNTPGLPSNIMFRNAHPPSGSNSPIQVVLLDTQFKSLSFMADEPAFRLLTFGPEPWQYQIEWYGPSLMGMGGAPMDMVNFTLTIGRWRGMA